MDDVQQALEAGVEAGLVDLIIAREGGWTYTDHPADRGGPTFAGVTWTTWAAWRRRMGLEPVSDDDFAARARAAETDAAAGLRDQVREIYAGQFVAPWAWLRLRRELHAAAVDCGVNCGVSRAVSLLQRAAGPLAPGGPGLTVDGIAGPATRGAALAADEGRLLAALTYQRCVHYARLVQRDPSQAVFLAGWLRRSFEAAGWPAQ